jgi:hypothetical protein
MKKNQNIVVLSKGLTKKIGRQGLLVLLVSKVNGMKKNDDNELNVCHGGFDVATQEKKLGQ